MIHRKSGTRDQRVGELEGPVEASNLRRYSAGARSTDVFGRVLCSARNHHFVVDGPVQNGCPGEEITPGELFLSGIASCAVELVQALARGREMALEGIEVGIEGTIDPDDRGHPELTLFKDVGLGFALEGSPSGRRKSS